MAHCSIFVSVQLNAEDFRDSVIALGFTEEAEAILSKLYSIKKDEVTNTLEEIGFKLPKYHDMEWRFEVQVYNRCFYANSPFSRAFQYTIALFCPCYRLHRGAC